MKLPKTDVRHGEMKNISYVPLFEGGTQKHNLSRCNILFLQIKLLKMIPGTNMRKPGGAEIESNIPSFGFLGMPFCNPTSCSAGE